MTVELDVTLLAAAIADKLHEERLVAPLFYSVKAVAEMLDCTPAHVHSLIKAGALEGVDIAAEHDTRSSPRVSHQSFTRLIDSRKLR